MTARGSAQSHVADFDVGHQLQALTAKCHSSINHLKSSLRRQGHVLCVDRDDLDHLGHIHDGPGG